MASNYVQPGKVLTLVAPYDRTTGQGALVGSIFGVALQTVLNTVEGEFQLDGVWTLAKTSAQAWTQGQKIYWDDGNKRCDSDSTVGKLIGVASEAADNPSSTGNVRLSGSTGGTSEGLGLDAAEYGLLDGATAGSITASKVVTRDAAKAIPIEAATLAALGNSQGTAAPIVKQVSVVTGADNTTAVVLPTAAAGQAYVVINSVANKALPVYPATGAQINGGGANAAFTLGPGQAAVFHCTAALTWYVEGQAAATPTTTELALLAGAGTGGTPVASKAQIADANQNIGAVKATSLAIGVTGAEVALTATVAELNALAGAGVSAAEATQLGLITATAAEINALASAASGLGSSNSYAKTDNGVKTLLAAHATKDRGVLVVVTVDETFADNGGNQTVVKIGETDTDNKCMAVGVLVGATAGEKHIFGFTNTSTKAILATLTAAVAAGTGGVSILVLALPNS